MPPTKAVRNATKKLKNYETKNPGVKDERYAELQRGLIIANVAAARLEQSIAKSAESHRFKDMSDDDFLEIEYQKNSQTNSDNRRKEKNKKRRERKKEKIAAEKIAEYQVFYDQVVQPAIAKHIILSL